ncbi:GTP-binding protein [Nonomuraea sp. NPDC050786]|uniref:GTP-binding protein n=1 Tax=Nonomuraea sp. NPDC050786 TaxID=3154840 RepID=UPI0033D2962A
MAKFIALSGFLGAGKTTTMTAAAQRLRADGLRVAVVTNDQGAELVDTALAATRLDGVGEVTGGCFCCRFDDLLGVTSQLVRQQGADVVIAESVGSCTDLTATVVRPMLALHGDSFRVAPLTTIVDPLRYRRLLAEIDRGDDSNDMAYLYRKQLEDAAVIGLNKVDLLEHDEVKDIMSSLAERFPNAEIVAYSAGRQDIDPLLQAWTRDHGADDTDLVLDYERYGEAEARLAWLNQTITVHATTAPFAPTTWATTVLDEVSRRCQAAGHTIGHVKIMLEDLSSGVLTKASLIDTERPPAIDLTGSPAVQNGRAILNARVECEPEELEALTAVAVSEADRVHGTDSSALDQRSFKPGQPRPTHRLLVEADHSQQR